MPRVVWIFEYPVLNGAEHSLLAMQQGLQAQGVDLIALAPPHGELANALRVLKIPVEGSLDFPTSATRNTLTEKRQRLAEHLRRLQPDLVHANSLAMARVAGPVSLEAGLPCLGHVRDIVGLSRQAMADVNASARLLTVSQAVRDWHLAAGMSAAKTHVLYNGVDLERFRPQAARGTLHAELQLADEALLVGGIGQIGLRKGWDVLLTAAEQFAHKCPIVHYLIVGQRHAEKAESVEFERSLQARAATGPLRGRVHWLGRRSDIPMLLPELAVLVHPARQEPLGRVLLEAGAAGVAIVASDVGGTREIFPTKLQAARLVPPENPEALAEQLTQLLADPPLRQRLGQAARQRIARHFGVALHSRALFDHYSDLLPV